jgi:hypothetical protein
MTRDTDLERAHAAALARWCEPLAEFTSGRDPRSSDNALLALTYGGLAHAARHAWLNAGRRLIDRTYLEILRQVQALTVMRSWRSDAVAAALDDFIRDRIAAHWPRLPALDATERAALAVDWVEQAGRRLFGSQPSETAASRLLFFLCPMLPVFNLSRGHQLALARLGEPPADDGYAAFAAAAERAFTGLVPRLQRLPRPTTHYGDAAQRALIDGLLADGDWWERRVFDALLRGLLEHEADAPLLFACDDVGRLTAQP